MRSIEGTDFRMYKLLLALASLFFKQMFEIPQPMNSEDEEKGRRLKSEETRDGIPVISLYDDKNQSSKRVISAEMVFTVVDVAARYDISWAVKTALRDPSLLPFLLFAIACQKRLAAEATLAAEGTLRFRLADFPHEPALKLTSGYQYHSLQEFHKRCGRTVQGLATLGPELQSISPEVLHLIASHSQYSRFLH